MAKQRQRPRSASKDSSKVPSLYRVFESFLVTVVNKTQNLPKIPMIQEISKRLTNELLDCSASVSYAYNADDLQVRYDYLAEMAVHLQLIKTIIEVLHEYSSKTNSKVVTTEHLAEYLPILENIEIQRRNWMESTKKSILSTNPTTPSSTTDSASKEQND